MDTADGAVMHGATEITNPAAADRRELLERWALPHGVEVAWRLAAAKDLADPVVGQFIDG